MKNLQLIIILLISFMLLAGMGNVVADPIGRLFTTPKQRVFLDKIRRNPSLSQVRTTDDSEPVVDKTAKVNVNGVVIRKDGKNIVWINGKSNLKTSKPEVGVKVRSRNIRKESVTLLLSHPNKRVTLKPGQIIDPVTGKVSEVYKLK